MAVNAMRKINELFPTPEAAKVFDYLVENREPATSNQLAFKLQISPEKTYEALESFKKKSLVFSVSGGVPGSSGLVFYSINSDGLEQYQKLKAIK
jgi:hypothetical protein